MPTLLDIDKQVFSPPELGCVLYLPGLPGSGSKIYDRSPYGNIGTKTGATWKRLPSGLWYLSHDGADDYTKIADADSLDLGTDDYTLIAWIKTSTENRQTIFIKSTDDGGNTSPPYWYFEIYKSGASGNNGKLHERRHDGTTVSSEYGTSTTTYDGAWHLVGISADRDVGASFFQDGAADGGGANSSGQLSLDNNGSLFIGIESDLTSNFDFNGDIALPRIIKGTALTAEQWAGLYAQEKHLFGVW